MHLYYMLFLYQFYWKLIISFPETSVVFILDILSNMSGMISTTERLGTVTSLTLTSEGFPILDALTIVTRSMHNCNVFGYYGGIQKVTSLMKGIFPTLSSFMFHYLFFKQAISFCHLFDSDK